MATLLLGHGTSFEQDQCLEAVRTAGSATREGVLQAALTGQPTPVPTSKAPTPKAAELAARISKFSHGCCDWPKVLGVAGDACDKEIKRAFYNVLRSLKDDGYKKNGQVMVDVRLPFACFGVKANKF